VGHLFIIVLKTCFCKTFYCVDGFSDIWLNWMVRWSCFVTLAR